jgi:hypothetical protein
MAPIRFSAQSKLAIEQTVMRPRGPEQGGAVYNRKHLQRLWLFFCTILSCAQAVPEAKAAEVQLGAPCSHPGETTMASVQNPNTQKWNFVRIVCAYSDNGAGWRVGSHGSL